MVGWHHQLNGHEFEQTAGDSEGQGSLTCCSPWGHKGWDLTNNSDLNSEIVTYVFFSHTHKKRKDLATNTRGISVFLLVNVILQKSGVTIFLHSFYHHMTFLVTKFSFSPS